MHPALGIDHGDARIGIAATDPMGILAYPVETVKNEGDPVSRIAALAAQKGAKTIILGIPVRMDGTEGTAAAKVRLFGDQIAAAMPDIPLFFVDECLTTVAAQEKLRAAGKKVKNQKSIIDQAAAVEILNIWMDQQF